MTFDAGILRQQLRELETAENKPSKYVVAFSGGLDSSVLLHALATAADGTVTPVLAVHIDHGLQDESGRWAEHCADFAASLGVDYRCRSVEVQLESGKGPEASAREARYSALIAELEENDWLLSAHHCEDQAETLLLNLIRGSGPMGIAGIGRLRRFGPGWLVRPLLDTGRESLLEYGKREGLKWLEDPANIDRRFDRNFLRHDIVPRLGSRWPDISARLQRSARHAGEASQLIRSLAEIDLDSLGGRPARLPVDGLLTLSEPRQKNLLRHALRLLGLSTPTAIHVDRILGELIPARADAQPLVSWPGASVRRYRNQLYLLPETITVPQKSIEMAGDHTYLGAGLGSLELLPGAPTGLAERLQRRGLAVRFRQGGEEIQPEGHTHTRKLKKLLQEEGVVPWMRDRLPLLYAGDELVAVADLWLAASAVARPGLAVRWRERPAIH